MMEEWRSEWHEGTGGATDPSFPIGFVQIGPYTDAAHADGAAAFAIRMGQTADYGYAPNPRWPHSFMATAFDLANPPGTHCVAGCIHIFNKQARRWYFLDLISLAVLLTSKASMLQAVAHRLALAARQMAQAITGSRAAASRTTASVSRSLAPAVSAGGGA